MWTEIHSGSFYRNSLSSKMGATGIMYGAEAGTGPGVWADSRGDLRPESSGLIPEPLIWIAANTCFFLQALQRPDKFVNSTVKPPYTINVIHELHYKDRQNDFLK